MVIKVLIVLLCFTQGTAALQCYECKDKESNNACAKMGPDFDGDALTPDGGIRTCGLTPAVGERLVCVKTITSYQAVGDPDNKGVIAQRYCDVIKEADQCWESDGTNTHSVTCACSEDLCNASAGLFNGQAAALLIVIVSFFFLL